MENTPPGKRKRRSRTPWRHSKRRRIGRQSTSAPQLLNSDHDHAAYTQGLSSPVLVHTPSSCADLGSHLLHAPKKRRICQTKPKAAKHLDFDGAGELERQKACEKLVELLPALVTILYRHSMLADFMTLIALLVCGKMSMLDIPFMLLLEKARFLNLSSTNSMYYWPQTMKFWIVVYRLLKGKAIRLLSGTKNAGAILGGEVRGHLKPSASSITFAVPSMEALRVTTCDQKPLPKETPPGLIPDAVDIARQSGKPFVLSMDAKKVAMGLQADRGDIDLWGHEKDGGFKKKNELLQSELGIAKAITDQLTSSESSQELLQNMDAVMKDNICQKIKVLVAGVSQRIRQSREMIVRQNHALEKFQRLSETPEGAQKYQYALSSTKAYLFQARRFINRALTLNGQLMSYGTHMIGDQKITFSLGPEVDVSKQANMVRLKEPQELPIPCRIPELTKQRTPEWQAIRKLAPVTGSTLYNALGLRTLKDQKLHYDVHVAGQVRPEPDPQTAARMLAGTENECHAAATLAAVIMPFLYPSATLVEEGARLIRTNNRDLIEVSADGVLRTGPSISHVVEIKCPWPAPYKTPVQYSPPHWYICQLLAEMASTDTDCALFVSYSTESTAICEVRFDADLWQTVLNEVERQYGPTCKKPTKLADSVGHLKKEIGVFIDTHVSFIAEVPSVRGHNLHHGMSVEDSPYVHALPHHQSKISSATVAQLQSAVTEACEVLKEGFQLCREKASEILAFVLSDVDRLPSAEVPHHLPVAYAMKGYSLPIRVARKMCLEVVRSLHKAGVEVACLSTDGQFHNIICRGLKNQPLTLGQLQKDVWQDMTKIAKSDLLAAIKPLGVVKAQSFHQVCQQAQVAVRNGSILVSSKDGSLSSVKTPVRASLWKVAERSPDKPLNQESKNPVSKWDWSNEVQVAATLQALKDTYPQKFSSLTTSELKLKTSSAVSIAKSFSNKDINTVVSTMPISMLPEVIRQSWPKWRKVNILAKVLGDSSQTMPAQSSRRRLYPLKQLAFGVIKKTHPKPVISAVMAEYEWPKRLGLWKKAGTVDSQARMDGTSNITWYSQVEDLEGKLLPACVDPSHLLTNMRVKATKDGIRGVDREAFVRVAERFPEVLNKALVCDMLDKQNVAFACRVFSPDVAECMMVNGDHETAEFVILMHEWYEAVDRPGLSAKERVERLLNMKHFLLHKHWTVDFARFPPLGSHVKGIPFIWFDSMLQGIDTRLQMYSILGTYSHRALGTLAVESFFGDLTEMDQTKLGCPKAIHIPRLMAITTQINSYRHDPSSRLFCMATSAAAVYPRHMINSDHSNIGAVARPMEHGVISEIAVRDHIFDEITRKKKKPKRKKADVSKPDKPARGTRPVRQHHYRDESKLLPTDRLGVSSIELDAVLKF